MTKLLLIGASGILGSELKSKLIESTYAVATPTSLELDIRDKKLVYEKIFDFKPDWIINCSAWTRVDEAEDFPNEAREINDLGVRNIAEIAFMRKTQLIHLSTDYVFDGKAERPYSETDPPKPINVYGHTKFLGERAILDVNSNNSYIVRTSWLYGTKGQNFVTKMLRKAINQEVVGVVNNQFGSPTSSRDLAAALIKIVEQNPKRGIYNFTNLGFCSWFEFAQEIYRLVGANINLVKPILAESLNLRANRPGYSVLSKDKWIESGLGIPPHWKDSLHPIVLELLKIVKSKEVE